MPAVVGCTSARSSSAFTVLLCMICRCRTGLMLEACARWQCYARCVRTPTWRPVSVSESNARLRALFMMASPLGRRRSSRRLLRVRGCTASGGTGLRAVGRASSHSVIESAARRACWGRSTRRPGNPRRRSIGAALSSWRRSRLPRDHESARKPATARGARRCHVAEPRSPWRWCGHVSPRRTGCRAQLPAGASSGRAAGCHDRADRVAAARCALRIARAGSGALRASCIWLHEGRIGGRQRLVTDTNRW